MKWDGKAKGWGELGRIKTNDTVLLIGSRNSSRNFSKVSSWYCNREYWITGSEFGKGEEVDTSDIRRYYNPPKVLP